MKAISLFSGIGGISCGFKMAGVDTAIAVEFDSNNQAYSLMSKDVYVSNFPGCEVILKPVQEVVHKLPKCELLQASPVCSNFSSYAKCNNASESALDREMAIAVMDAIATTKPQWFMLEQVPGYLTSDCFKQICEFLLANGYWYDYKIINMADYGVPQSRKRLILLAGLGAFWSFPKKERKVGWLEAIAGTINQPTLSTNHQKKIIGQLPSNVDFLIQRTGIDHAIRFPKEPCWTLTRSMFTDTRQAARTNVINAYINGEFLNLSMRAIARLSSFPDWFNLDFKHIGQGIGYAVPPYFVKKCVEQILPVKSKGEKK